MAYVLALSAALSSACAGVLQRIGVESAPEGATMRLSLLTHALRRKVWLAGFALLLTTFVLQAMALRFGDLAVVQPVMTTELLFLIIILATHFHRQLGWREWIGAAAIVAGLAGFLAMAAPSTGRAGTGGSSGGSPWWPPPPSWSAASGGRDGGGPRRSVRQRPRSSASTRRS